MSTPSSSWRRDVLRRPRKGDIVPRTAEKLKRHIKSVTCAFGVPVERASRLSGLSATHEWKLHSALFKVSLHDCLFGRVCGYFIVRQRGGNPDVAIGQLPRGHWGLTGG